MSKETEKSDPDLQPWRVMLETVRGATHERKNLPKTSPPTPLLQGEGRIFLPQR